MKKFIILAVFIFCAVALLKWYNRDKKKNDQE